MAVDDLQSKAADLVKKILTVGVGAIFLTEESLRNLVGEFKLPKEFITGVLESANKTKNDFFQKLSTDVLDRISSKMDVMAVVEEFLERNEVELQVKIRFKPKSDRSSATPSTTKDS